MGVKERLRLLSADQGYWLASALSKFAPSRGAICKQQRFDAF